MGFKSWVLLFTLCCISGPALADKRVALVVGNGDYEFANKLDNPRFDARAMRDALEKLDFTVVYGEDLDKSSLEKRIGDFALAVRDADVAIVYFAGHGATFGDIPYVVPVDAQFDAVEKIPYELVPAEALIGELRRAKGVRIAILDACRDNKLEMQLKEEYAKQHGGLGRGLVPTRGLAKVQNTNGLIIAYATQYMKTAADGPPGEHSPFTASLVSLIGTPNLDVKDLFFKVAQDVIAKTSGRQWPEISVSLFDNYELVYQQDTTSTALEELLHQAGATYDQMSYDPGSHTITINDLVENSKKPGFPAIKISQLVLSQLVINSTQQFSAQRIEIKGGDFTFGQDEKGRIEDLVAENVSLAPAALQLSQLAALAEAVPGSDQPTFLGTIVTRLAEGISGIHIGKLDVRGVRFDTAQDALNLGALNLNKFENGKFSDLSLTGLSIAESGEAVRVNRVVLKGFDLSSMLRISMLPHDALESRPPDQIGSFLSMLDSIEVDDFTFPDRRSGQMAGQMDHIDSLKASWGQFIGVVPTTIHITAKGTIPILPSDEDFLQLLRDAGQKSYSFSIDLEGRWTASSQTFVVSPAVFEFGNLFSASAILTIDNVSSNVFADHFANVEAAIATFEVGLIELSVRDTGGVSLLIDEAAKAQNVSVQTAREAVLQRIHDRAQSEGSMALQQFVGPFSQFIESPGATLKIILTPKDRVTVNEALRSLNSGPDGLLADFDLTIGARPSPLAEPK